MKNDPKQLKSKFNSICTKCKKPILKNQIIYYWPSDKTVYCIPCGYDDYKAFLEAKQDEDTFSGLYYSGSY